MLYLVGRSSERLRGGRQLLTQLLDTQHATPVYFEAALQLLEEQYWSAVQVCSNHMLVCPPSLASWQLSQGRPTTSADDVACLSELRLCVCGQVDDVSPGALFPAGPAAVQLPRSFEELAQRAESLPELPRLAVVRAVLQWQQRLQAGCQPTSMQERRDILQVRPGLPASPSSHQMLYSSLLCVSATHSLVLAATAAWPLEHTLV